MGNEKRTRRFYSASLLKRSRRTKAEIENLLGWVKHILSEQDGPITIRHLFYLLVGHGIIEKTEKAYSVLAKFLAKWRRSGEVDYDAFADNTRWHIKPDTHRSMSEALETWANNYRRDLWSRQAYYIEIWCEKDACASILSTTAGRFGVPVFVARGFASISSLYSAANTFRSFIERGKRCIIYHFGDHDPSGIAACESIKKALRTEFAVDVEVIRAAVTKEQIRRLKLPTRPTKESSHSQMKSWRGGDSVELDAMPVSELRALVEDCITRHIDKAAWESEQTWEILERETFQEFNKAWSNRA